MKSEKNIMNEIFIIAEAGVNHNGDLEIAKKLITKAKEAGADAVKFQTYQTNSMVCKNAVKADYQLHTTQNSESQCEMLQKLELNEKAHFLLANYCKEQQIMFMSTPFDIESIQLLEKIQLPLYKIPSGEVTNYPYLKAIGLTHKPIILSTGMCTLQEIEDCIRVLKKNGSTDISLLHCNTEYPTPMRDVNLNAMKTLHNHFNLPVGYSDHTEGIEIALAATAMGAVIIEKHFTLDKTMQGPDHKASIEPQELKQMVKAIRNIQMAMGDGIKQPSQSEEKNIMIARKSIVAKRMIAKGELLTEENITVKRPGTGLNPMNWNSIIGSKAKKDFMEDEMIAI